MTATHAASASEMGTPVALQTVVVVGTHALISSRSGVQAAEMNWLVVPPLGVLRSPATKSAHCAGAASKPQRICAPPSSESFTEHEASTALAHQAPQSVAKAPVGPSRIVSGPRFANHCEDDHEVTTPHETEGVHTEPPTTFEL